VRNLLFIALTSISIFGGVQAEPLSPADINNVLTRIRERRAAAPYVQANFQEEKIIRLMNKPIVSTGKVWFQAPNKFRREVKGNAPSIMVSDGQQLWIYYPTFKSAERYSLGQRSPLDKGLAAVTAALNLENVETAYQITGAKEGKGYELELTPRRASTKKLFQKFDLHLNDDLLVDRTEMFQINGERIVTTYSNQTRAPIPASTFEFSPPPGTEITTPLGR
jgi:chaperone LolA